MNREETRKAAEVMLHYANGGEVERASRKQQDHWTSLGDYDYPDGPLWDWRDAIYRKKPQPVEVIAWAVYCGGMTTLHFSRHLAEEKAESHRIHSRSVPYVVELKGTYTCDTH